MALMTYIVPNYFLEDKPHNVISSDSVFTLAYSSRRNQECVAVRNTTHVMIFLLKGTKVLKTQEKEIVLRENELFFLTQGNYLMSEVVSDDGNFEAIMVYFDDAFMLSFIQKYSIEPQPNHRLNIVTFRSNKFLKSLIDSCQLYMNQELTRKNEIIKLKIEEIFLHVLEQDAEKFLAYLNAIESSSKNRIKYILEANLDLIQNIDDMCKIARVTKNELRLFMLNHFGMQPKEWLNSKRLEQAAILLRNSNNSIVSIATTCGYSTSSWFGAQFKKMYGMTPKAYRLQN
ncbi:MAG: AraC family transcriptional regulator [uncultured Sulfurovum sp.]|uniref:AraC family transcriptional regulator n=1 Tax=uncultured Sulfurovum sp. TaxID=269237 RepID=A0A6S6SBN4_9BACT|nr:MAG: AraC family transcriptional regulator [uncultured Sulfurovum sp.]